MDFKKLYELFSAEMTPFDCGRLCAPHNPTGKPFCCDICHAVPAAYLLEWEDLQQRTDLWHEYRGNECAQEPTDPKVLLAETPEHMLLLACKGPVLCQREVRAISCRQFPFYPYIDSHNRFIGLAYEWAFEPTCWVISHLDTVTAAYRRAFVAFYDHLFSIWEHDLDSYAAHSEEARAYFIKKKRCIPLLHRDGDDYLVSPESEHLQPVSPLVFRRFEPYV
jgi:hypothetical protein